jgi:hypothetical protein
VALPTPVATLVLHNRALTTVTGTVVALTGYVAFLFLCFVGYAFLYGHLNPRRRADYVVVLGSGLVGGSTVPPLLAGRLERARAVHAGQPRRGRRPVLLTSGGQGPDEKLPESHAMADYWVNAARTVSALLDISLSGGGRGTRSVRRFPPGVSVGRSRCCTSECTPGVMA